MRRVANPSNSVPPVTAFVHPRGTAPVTAILLLAFALGAAGNVLAAEAQLEIVDVTIDDSGNTHSVGQTTVNGYADPGETVLLRIEVRNAASSGPDITGIVGTLHASFGGVNVATAVSPYEDIAANSSAENSPGFVVPLSQDLPCGGRISLKLTMESAGHDPTELWTSIVVGRFSSVVHEHTISAGDPGMLSPVLLSRGDHFDLLYALGPAREVRYEPFGAHGEPGPIQTLIQVGSDPTSGFSATLYSLGSPAEEVAVAMSVSNLGPPGKLFFRSLKETANKDLGQIGEQPALAFSKRNATFGLFYVGDVGPDRRLLFMRLDVNGMPLGPPTPVSSVEPGNPKAVWVSSGSIGRFVAVFETIQSGHVGLRYVVLNDADGATVASGVVRDPLGTGNAVAAAIATSAAEIGIVWADTRHEPNEPDCIPTIDPGGSPCLSQIYYRPMFPTLALGSEVRLTPAAGAAPALSPSITFEAGEFHVVWWDLRLDADKTCGTDSCIGAVFRQRVAPDGTLAGVNEHLFSSLTIGQGAPLIRRSMVATGHLLFVRSGNVPNQPVLGFRQVPDEETWVKLDPGENEVFNERVLSLGTSLQLGGSLGRLEGRLLGVWAENSAPGEPQLKFRLDTESGLGPVQTLVDSPSGLEPVAVGPVVNLPGGEMAVSFIDATDPNAVAGDVYLIGFQNDGTVTFPPTKVNSTVGPWSSSLAAVVGDHIGVVYESAVSPGPKVRFRIFDASGSPVTGESSLDPNDPNDVGSTSAALAALPERFVVGWINDASDPTIQLREPNGAGVGSPVVLSNATNASQLVLATGGERIATFYATQISVQAGRFEIRDATGAPLPAPIVLDLLPDAYSAPTLSFTGHQFLLGWGGFSGPRWVAYGPDGIASPKEPVSVDLFPLVASSGFDGYEFAFASAGQDFFGVGLNLHMERFIPPPSSYTCRIYNSMPTVWADANDPDPNVPYQMNLGEDITLTARATSGLNGSTDPGDTQLSFFWDINRDGVTDFTGASVYLTAEMLTSFGIDTADTFAVWLTVKDSQAGTPLEGSVRINVVLIVKDFRPPNVRVVSPDGGESWPVGSSQVISWEASDDVGVDHVDLYYATDFSGSSGTWQLIGTEPGSKSSHTFTVPNALSATARIRVVAFDNADEQVANSAADVSDANLYFIQATTAAVRTLIVTHLGRMNALYPGSSGALVSKLNELAMRDSVSGVILALDNVPAVNTALNAWDAAHTANSATSQDEALAAADAIHDYLWAPGTGQASSVFTQARYLVLVGEDKVVPFFRVKDSTGVLPESAYASELSATSTVGAALKASSGAPGGHYLSDDYYGAAEPEVTKVGANELWLPSVAVGRLVQTPSEIQTQVNRFIAQDGEVRPTRALVSGYDFLVDGAQDIAGTLTQPGITVDSGLIGQSWTPGNLACRLLGQAGCTARPQLVSLNGHATHFELGSAQGSLSVTGLSSGTQPLAGAVEWGMGCHSGLVEEESQVRVQALDVVQALNRLGVVAQVGQTGFGWGFRHGVGLTEALMRDYAERLMAAPSVGVGDALVAAKKAYFLSAYRYDVFDEKVLQEATLYGLPMYSVVNGTSARIPRSEPRFAAMEPDGKVRRSGIGVGKRQLEELPPGLAALQLDFRFGSETLQRIDTADGSYYELNGLTTSEIGNPLEPMFLFNSTTSLGEFRGVLFTGGEYTEQTGFNPATGVPQSNNEDRGEGPLPNDVLFLPGVRQSGGSGSSGRGTGSGEAGESRMIVSVGHYLGSGRHRLFDAMNFISYYSTSADRTAPQIEDPGPNGVLHEETATGLRFTVQASDDEELFRVLVTYSDEQGTWKSLELIEEVRGTGESSSWSGEVAGVKSAKYIVQAVDAAGNSTVLAQASNDMTGGSNPQEWGTETLGPRVFDTEAAPLVPVSRNPWWIGLCCVTALLARRLAAGHGAVRSAKRRATRPS